MSPEPPITLRAAEPVPGEGRAFARYLDQAAEGFFRMWLGRRAVDIVARAYLRPGHDLSHEHVTFAERDGDIVGMSSGYTAAQHRDSSDAPLLEAVGPRRLRMSVLALVFAPLLRIIDTVEDGDFYLQAVAVDPELRGRGVGTILLDAVEARARAVGSARLSLDVSGGNPGARRFYERRGMTVESRWPRRLVIPGIRLYRMTKDL